MVPCSSIPDSTIDQVTKTLLENSGVATIPLPFNLEKVHKEAFLVASSALDDLSKETPTYSECPIIQIGSNSAEVTGYHSNGGADTNALSRYNVHRQGFIFSNGGSFDIPINGNVENDGQSLSFQKSMDAMFDSLCNDIASGVLRGIARHLNIDQDWFQDTYGPMDQSSQWHLKRYIEPSKQDIEKYKEENSEGGGSDEIEWLPVHTDPSLISIIIHDAPGSNENAMGLEYQVPVPPSDENGNSKKDKVWKEVGCHGHAVATVFCGSVMSYITGGLFQSAKHRVMYRPNNSSNKSYRQAATLFLRPRGESILTIPPSDVLLETGRREPKIRRNCKFQDWLNRVSRNYQGGSKSNNCNKDKLKKIQKKQTKTIRKDADPMHWSDDYTELTLHGCAGSALNGKEKFLGGELCELNEHIYTIPGFARRILDMDVSTDPPTMKLMGPDLPGEFKWLRGIPIGETIYGIPCHSDAVLKINALTNDVSLVKWDDTIPGSCPSDQPWKYHGAAVSDHDGCIYCIPQAAERVMKIDPKTDEITFIGPNFPGVNKWYGGLLLKDHDSDDHAIYGVCQNATGILRIDPKTQECTIHGDFPEGNYKWHGGVKHPDGNLYCIPAHADQVLKVEPGKIPKLSLLGKNIRTGEHRSDGKYKFLGGAVGADNVYFFPSDADYVCQVNTITGEVKEVGPNLRDHEHMRNNKWQNGFTAVDRDGNIHIYGIPLKGETVLRILPDKNGGEPHISTIGGPYLGLNKWEGGVSASNGDMYCMPLNHKFSLRIRPLTKKKIEEEEKNDSVKYTHGLATLRSSAHTLRYSKSRINDNGPSTGGNVLPVSIRNKHLIRYDIQQHDLRKEIIRMLQQLDPEMVGTFRQDNESQELKLENFVVPEMSLLPAKKSRSKNGKGEKAQKSLSDYVTNDVEFHNAFDRFVESVILPELKDRLLACGAIQENIPVHFEIQRPPTLRIQPGPSTRAVAAHNDATYGHQDGELNFWMPLSDPKLTKTDLWCESKPGLEDYAPLGARLGEVVAFHGSSCKHYAPPNESIYTRVSLDFRVGVVPYYDPEWRMLGTKSDHLRKKVVL